MVTTPWMPSHLLGVLRAGPQRFDPTWRWFVLEFFYQPFLYSSYLLFFIMTCFAHLDLFDMIAFTFYLLYLFDITAFNNRWVGNFCDVIWNDLFLPDSVSKMFCLKYFLWLNIGEGAVPWGNLLQTHWSGAWDIRLGGYFALGFMSADQVRCWNSYGKRAVMMDATHKFSRRKLKLFTILVIGPYEKGIPVASLVCKGNGQNWERDWCVQTTNHCA